MLDEDKSREQLIAEVRELRGRFRPDLERREAIVRAIVEYSVEAIVAVGRDGQIVLANPSAETMFGYQRGELLGKRVETLIPDRSRSVHEQHRADYFARPRTRAMGAGRELTGRRKDGTGFPLEIGLAFVSGEDRGLAIAFVTDISERVAQEQQAQRAEKLATLGSLAAGIAHEINNPISILLSRIELMLMEGKEREAGAELLADLHVLHRHADHLGRIARHLLTFGRKPPRGLRRVDLSVVVDDTLLLTRKALSRDGIEVHTSLDSDLPSMLGDATALEQVLLNLILNARDAMPGGGTLRIEASRTPAANGIRLRVSDSGCGMPAAVVARLAEPFFTTKPTGTGLGLSVSYRIVREHGGTVSVESEPERGTTFIMVFPAASFESRP